MPLTEPNKGLIGCPGRLMRLLTSTPRCPSVSGGELGFRSLQGASETHQAQTHPFDDAAKRRRLRPAVLHKIGQGAHVWPLRLSGCPQGCKNLGEHVQVAGPNEPWPPQQQLCRQWLAGSSAACGHPRAGHSLSIYAQTMLTASRAAVLQAKSGAA